MLDQFQQAIKDIAHTIDSDHWYVGLSGGVDSTLLLYCLSQYCRQQNIPLTAIHVHHGISQNADEWLRFCEAICRQWNVFCVTEKVTLDDDKQQGTEQLARRARWNVFDHQLPKDAVLWLAHHQDDQVETLMLNLLRGTGVQGARAMQSVSFRQHYRVIRPWLHQRKDDILLAANEAEIHWVEDESNLATDIRRNFLRHKIFPQIEHYWQGYRESLYRFTEHMQQTDRLLTELANDDLQPMLKDDGLELSSLMALSRDRQINVLRHWFDSFAYYLPSQEKLHEFVEQLSKTTSDGHCECQWGPWAVKQSGSMIHRVAQQHLSNVSFAYEWKTLEQPLVIEELDGRCLCTHDGKGLRPPEDDETVFVKSREGGERCWPDFRNKSTSLKKVFQELNIPSWQRDKFPLIFYNDKLVAVVGLFLDKEHVVDDGLQFIFTT